jgi:hypothetical protein
MKDLFAVSEVSAPVPRSSHAWDREVILIEFGSCSHTQTRIGLLNLLHKLKSGVLHDSTLRPSELNMTCMFAPLTLSKQCLWTLKMGSWVSDNPRRRTPYLQAAPIARLDHSPREIMSMKSSPHALFPSFSETLSCVGFRYTPEERVGENSNPYLSIIRQCPCPDGSSA